MTTWTAENGKLWLRDFLPPQLPSARIMSFGYNSDTALRKAVTDIDDVALMLLSGLNLSRQLAEERKRPIIFISHSLGGIVVKKALILAHERLNRFKDLLDSICASVFFGVPHRGSDTANLGTFVANLSKALPGYTNTRFISALKKGSPILEEISRQFIERGASLQIRTFYETEVYYNQLVC